MNKGLIILSMTLIGCMPDADVPFAEGDIQQNTQAITASNQRSQQKRKFEAKDDRSHGAMPSEPGLPPPAGSRVPNDRCPLEKAQRPDWAEAVKAKEEAQDRVGSNTDEPLEDFQPSAANMEKQRQVLEAAENFVPIGNSDAEREASYDSFKAPFFE